MDGDSLLQVVISHCRELDNTDPTNRNLLLMVRIKYFCLKIPGAQRFLDASSFLSTHQMPRKHTDGIDLPRLSGCLEEPFKLTCVTLLWNGLEAVAQLVTR